MFVVGIVPRVDAGLSPSEIVALSQVDRVSDLQKIQEILETKMIRARLEHLHQLALRLDKIKVGGNGLGVLVVILLIGIFVVLYLQYSGRKVVIQKK
jgi:hypothetical protein